MLRRSVLAIALLAAACTAGDGTRPGGGEPGAPPDTPRAAADLLAWETRTFRREHGSCRREEVDSVAVPCLTVVVSYPELGDAASPALADSVRAFVRETAFAGATEEGGVAEDAAAVAAGLAREYDEIAAYGGDHVEVWALEREVTVRCQSPRVASLAAREYRYTGGAHGLETVRLASFDARTGRRLTLAALVADGAAATAAAERAFRRQLEIPPGRSLADAGYIFFDDDRFALTDNFALCGDTLLFHYDPYEIAPYALGATEFTLPLGEIRRHLAKEWR